MYSKLQKKYLPEFVYGGIDGAVTTLAIISGAIGAVLNPAIILILGFANLFADGFSMGVSKYLSSQSQKEIHRKHKDSKRYNLQYHQAIKRGIATFLSFIIVGFIPLLPFVLAIIIPPLNPIKFPLSIISTAIALLLVGGIKGKVVDKNITFSAFQTLLIGGIAAVIAFLVGFTLKGIV